MWGVPSGSTSVTVAVTSASWVWSSTVTFSSVAAAGAAGARSRARAGLATAAAMESARNQDRIIAVRRFRRVRPPTYEPFFANISGLSGAFSLYLSTVNSSVTLPLTPCVMVWGSITPLTFL